MDGAGVDEGGRDDRRDVLPAHGRLGGIVGDLDEPGAGVDRQGAGSQHGPLQVARAQVLVGSGLGIGVGEERVVLRYTVIGAGTDVGHHHVAADARSCGGVHRADRRVAVDGVGAFRVAAAGAGRPDDGVVSAQDVGDLVRGHVLDVRDLRPRTRRLDVGGVVGVADQRRHLVAAFAQDAFQVQGHFSVTSDDDDASHDRSFRGESGATPHATGARAAESATDPPSGRRTGTSRWVSRAPRPTGL